MEGRMGARNQYPDFMDALSVSQGLALILLLRFESLRMGESWKYKNGGSFLLPPFLLRERFSAEDNGGEGALAIG